MQRGGNLSTLIHQDLVCSLSRHIQRYVQRWRSNPCTFLLSPQMMQMITQGLKVGSTNRFAPRRLRKIETKKSIGNAINRISIPQEPSGWMVVWRRMDIARSLFIENRATEFAILLTVLTKCLPSFGSQCRRGVGILSFKALCDGHISCVL